MLKQGFDLEDGIVQGLKHSTRAILSAVGVGQDGERLLRGWELEVGVEVRRVVARVLTVTDLANECLVEVEYVLPEFDVRKKNDLLLHGLVANDGVVDRNASQIEVFSIVGRDKTIGNVRHIETCVRLACNVRLPVFGLECVDEALVETTEFGSKLDLVGNVGRSLRVTNANRLFDPKHIGQVGPRIGVLDRG